MVKVIDIIKKRSDLVVLVQSDTLDNIESARPVSELYNKEHISFIQGSDKKAKEMFNRFVGHCLIVSSDFISSSETKGAVAGTYFSILVSNNPRLSFMGVVKEFFYDRKKKTIHPSAQIGEGVVIGAGTTIHANVVIYDGVKIGKNCKVKAGSVLGGTGFGYEQNEHGEWINFPHIGSLIIGDNVEIGSNTCIDRGTLDDTIISDGVKIDNGVHIAHNVFVGENTLIIANSMVAGSVKIGTNSWIAPMSTIRDGLTIGNDCLIGLGAVVVKDVPNGTRVKGFPAKEF